LDHRKLREMEERIVSQATRGTVLLKFGGIGKDLLPVMCAHAVVDQVYVSGMSQDEACELAEMATNRSRGKTSARDLNNTVRIGENW
jgi:hypothetical protein